MPFKPHHFPLPFRKDHSRTNQPTLRPTLILPKEKTQRSTVLELWKSYKPACQESSRSLTVLVIHQGTQHIVTLMAMIYYSKSIQSKITKGKRYMGQSHKEARQVSKSPLSGESHRIHLILLVYNCDNVCEVLSPRKAHSRFSVHSFIAGWSCRHSLPGTYQISHS